ncbi:hypothetical protein HMPREF1987_00555 [Peptostreptococcaceae bacterium oral taxon 113 str. W5053]|nr:hypothetical protein HMPREF1987_00555 [Peptostreptococcaceae bacterium oral taxon 113 str. W5053]
MRDSINVISFSLLENRKEINFTDKKTELEKIKANIAIKQEEKGKYEKKLVQLQNR